ncbi:hypothetical protein [Streptomyces sp. NPDC049881]|uniref:hypothetical protein n=1 Tax=Streptomyces sp. NPDC049881 TaxID=3155778 RepID=UPI003428994D
MRGPPGDQRPRDIPDDAAPRHPPAGSRADTDSLSAPTCAPGVAAQRHPGGLDRLTQQRDRISGRIRNVGTAA